MKINTLIMDLDGTLLNSEKEIGQNDIDTIKKLKEKGVRIVLASGRHIEEIIEFSSLLTLSTDDVIVSSDGQYIYSGINKKIYEANFLTNNDVEIISNVFNNNRISFCTDKYDYFVKPSIFDVVKTRIKSFIAKKNKTRCFNDSYSILNIEKIIVKKNNLNQDIDIIKSKYCIHDFEKYIEIKSKYVNKYEGIRMAAKLFSFNLEESIFFGDDFNDIECFENIKYSVAMKNASDVIKSKAWRITDTNDRCGVSIGIESYLKECF